MVTKLPEGLGPAVSAARRCFRWPSTPPSGPSDHAAAPSLAAPRTVEPSKVAPRPRIPSPLSRAAVRKGHPSCAGEGNFSGDSDPVARRGTVFLVGRRQLRPWWRQDLLPPPGLLGGAGSSMRFPLVWLDILRSASSGRFTHPEERDPDQSRPGPAGPQGSSGRVPPLPGHLPGYPGPGPMPQEPVGKGRGQQSRRIIRTGIRP